MKQFIMMLLLVVQGTMLFAQQEKREIHKGNQLYNEQKYAEAEASYQKSLEKSKQSVAGNFNLGDAFYKQKKFDKAAEQFNALASSSKDAGVKAQAYHNLGNTLMENKKYEESIEAYKKSLMNNPKDDQTRYNLAYAMEKLKQQQQQNNKNKDNKDQKNKDQKDKNKDQKDKDDKNKDNKDQKDKDKKDQDKKDQDKKNQDQKDQQNGQKPQPDKLSKEDAKRMLEALNNEEKNTQDKLKNKKATGAKGRITKDW
ncbi:tetratricopeptide repeat protein [Pedobacter sp.]|jgi:Ca-activated chloride channel family protein|uniref:tetratricopeptide repeat protein n=1 Tax=Pedobacter sp. TaxID=1411316 RepID=UPI002C3731A0|nr:tetratricopeptide repeat protein [Pedobacter sp.]HWW43206.1 tetratricopeptide repeat protein [Pedobacter sp.]